MADAQVMDLPNGSRNSGSSAFSDLIFADSRGAAEGNREGQVDEQFRLLARNEDTVTHPDLQPIELPVAADVRPRLPTQTPGQVPAQRRPLFRCDKPLRVRIQAGPIYTHGFHEEQVRLQESLLHAVGFQGRASLREVAPNGQLRPLEADGPVHELPSRL